jgi:hypothetical protein
MGKTGKCNSLIPAADYKIRFNYFLFHFLLYSLGLYDTITEGLEMNC